MSFHAAHNAVVIYAIETGTISESADGTTPATLPDTLTLPRAVLGYTTLPQTSRGLNNSKGFALGQQGAAYNKRGAIAPTIDLTIRPGSVGAIANLLPNADGVLPWLAIWVVVKNQYSDVYRFCKPNSLGFTFGGGEGGGELSISAQMWATAYERTAAIPVDNSAIRALGTPLMWHDVRQFSIGGTPYRRALMSLSANVTMGLERKSVRPNWGDNAPLSRTSYHLLEHHLTASGEVSLHERLPETLFTTAQTAQDWGDIAIHCSDAAAVTAGSKGFTLTMKDCFPSDESMKGAEASAEIDHTVPFTANDIEFALD